MLKPKKKIKRREMKEDKLVTTYFRAYDKLYTIRKQLFTVGIIVVIAALGAIIYTNNLRTENERAIGELGKIFPYYDQQQYSIAISGLPAQGIPGLIEIAENFSRTEAGQLAKFYLANAHYHLGQYDEAYEYFERYRGKDPLLRASAVAGIAAIHEVHGEFDKAAEHFEKAAINFGSLPLSPEYLKHAGRNYLEAGKPQKAIRMFEKLKSDYPNSPYTRDIDRFIAQAMAIS